MPDSAAPLSIRSANCLRRLSPLSRCDLCQKLCPAQALHWQDEHWTADGCRGCGLCAAVCPTQVFQLDLPRLLTRDPAPLSLCCRENNQAPADAVRVGCLRQFSPETLLLLLYRHQKLTLYLTPEQCAQCPEGWYAQGLAQQLAQYGVPDDRLTVIVQTPPAQTQEQPQTERADDTPARRTLFRNLFSRAAAQGEAQARQWLDALPSPVAPAAIDDSDEADIFPARLPVYALYKSGALSPDAVDELPFRQLVCDDCTFCGACARLCPTGALSLEQTDAQKVADSGAAEQRLLFSPARCVGCGLCQDVCLRHGLRWQDRLTPAQLLRDAYPLAHSRARVCSRCGHEFYRYPPDDDDCCPFCRPFF